MNKELMFSSKTDMWETPQKLFDELDNIYHFTLDVCATKENTKTAKYFNKEIDGLTQEWLGSCWMNPPYGREIGKWILKAKESAQLNKATVVCLLPARTDTKWFHDIILPYATQITFVKGRLKFGGHKNAAPFPSMIVIFS